MNDDVFVVDDVTIAYGADPALSHVSLRIPRGGVTAFVGPSGCGKSTMLRTFNRMNDLVAGAHLVGTVLFDGADIHAPEVDLIDLRRRVGMVFQKPQVFPRSIYDNVAYGPALHGTRHGLDGLVERALTRAGLWAEVKDDLRRDATALSGGQQQRLVIARCLALEPEVILMDEPTASLDPVATAAVESLITELSAECTIVLVTHDLGQAARVSDHTAFFTAHQDDDTARHGELVEYGPTDRLFSDPADPRTAAYLRSAPGTSY